MGKNKGKKANQFNTSPENYLKTRARNLPIGKCYINEAWKSLGFATIVVSRNHTNGNSTFALFLVDIYCLGVKDTFCAFNKYGELDELVGKLKSREKMIEIEYPLAHNIIYGALEYADALGFKPHKEFGTTQYLLEEDDDRVELIEIEFGLNNKPAILVGKEKHPDNIIAALERSVGKGNFTIITENGFPEEEDFEEDEEEDEEELTEEDVIAILEGKKKPTPAQMFQITFPLYERKCTENEVAEMSEIVEELEGWEIVNENQTDDPPFLNAEAEDQYELLIEKTRQNPEGAVPEIEALIAEHPEEYNFYNLLGLAYEALGDTEKECEIIASGFAKFPDKILAFINYIIICNARNNTSEALKKLIGNKFDIHRTFPHRHKLSYSEMASLMGALFIYFSKDLGEVHKGVAYARALTDFIFYNVNKKIADNILVLAGKIMAEEMKKKEV